MSTSFVFQPDGKVPTLHYTRTEADGRVTAEETYTFKYMYGLRKGSREGGQFLVPREQEYLPSEVMDYLKAQEQLYNFEVLPESAIEGDDVQPST